METSNKMTNSSNALAVVPPQEVRDLGTAEQLAPQLMPRFRDDLKTKEQALEFAQVAIAYALDPFMDEIVPYEGKPYITIRGMVRIAGRFEEFDGIEDEPATKDERDALGIPDDEILWKAFAYRKDRSRPTKGYGRAGGKAERNALVSGRNRANMVFINAGLQARKRAIHNALRMAFPTQMPGELAENVSQAQLRALHAIDDERGIDREQRHHDLRELYDVEASNELTKEQASGYIDGRLVDMSTGEVIDDSLTVNQVQQIEALAGQLAMTENELLAFSGEHVGHAVTSMNQSEATQLIALLEDLVSSERPDPPHESSPGFEPGRMVGKPQTQAQMSKVFATANERGWTKEQVRGRAAEINPKAVESLDALDRAEVSHLIQAVSIEPPWVDPRQQRFDVDDAAAGDIADHDGPAAGPDETEITDWNEFWRWAKPKGYANATELCETLGIENRLDRYTPQQLVGMVVDYEANQS